MTTHPHSVLLVLVAGIGDFVMATPAIRAFRRGFPAARLALLTTPQIEGLARPCPYLDEVLTFDLRAYRSGERGIGWRGWPDFWALTAALRAQRFGLAVNLHQVVTLFGIIRMWLLFASIGADRTAGRWSGGRGFFFGLRSADRSHKADAMLTLAAALGCSAHEDGPELWVPEASRRSAATRLHEVGLRDQEPFAVLNIGSNQPQARLPVEKAVEIAREFYRIARIRILLTGNLGEAALTEAVASQLDGAAQSLAGRTDLLELAAILAWAKVVVTTDSAPMHIAATLGTPLVALCGPADPAHIGPRGRPECIVILTGHARPHDPTAWHTDLHAAEVIEAALSLLSASN